jgi:hypothetical protein
MIFALGVSDSNVSNLKAAEVLDVDHNVDACAKAGPSAKVYTLPFMPFPSRHETGIAIALSHGGGQI